MHSEQRILGSIGKHKNPMVFLTLKKKKRSCWKKNKTPHTFQTTVWPPGFANGRLPWSTPRIGNTSHGSSLNIPRTGPRGARGRTGPAVYPFMVWFQRKTGACIWGGQNPFILKKGMTSNIELNYKGHWDKWTRFDDLFQLSTLSGKLFLCRLGVKNCSIFFWKSIHLVRTC